MSMMDLIEQEHQGREALHGKRELAMPEPALIPPPPAFAAAANVHDPAIYEHARRDPVAFWAEQATRLSWRRPWDRPLEWETPWAKWFVGGSLNASENCVDRHLATWRKNKAAIIWEGEPGDQRVLTYRDLHREVGRAAAVLRRLGVGPGDRVAIYMPVIPELPIAMLACARLGAVHAVVFSGYSSEALADRVADCGARVLITADAGYHRGNIVPLKDNADVALADCPSIERVLVVRRAGEQQASVSMAPQRDAWWHEAVEDASWDEVAPPAVPSEHPLAIMYASGAAGRPKGLLHTTGGYLVGAATTAHWIYDLKEEDVFFCTADLGWSIGQTYGVYGPLLNGATVLLHEGTADMPTRDRYWRLVARHGVTVFVTTPSTIRMAMRAGSEPGAGYDLSSLRLLSTVGEPISADEWRWFHAHIGGGRCPIVNAWWQTEAGMAMIAPLPGLTALKPGSATLPLPGVAMDIVDDQGSPVAPDVPGYLVVKAPWPGMARSIWGDPDRYYRQYWGRFEATYVTGDGARRDADGYYWLLGRVDDVLNVAGQRLSSIEIENALAEHPSVAEAAVIGVRHPLKGQAIIAWVVLAAGQAASDAMTVELRAHVAEKIGSMARPDQIYYVAALPRAPGSPVVMRRLLRDIAEGRVPGGPAALLDPDVLAQYAEPLG
jgi:acetyl-CoA synthetase